MTLIRKGLVGLAALLAFSAQPAQGKERDSKILQCPVATYWQVFLEEQYAKSASQTETTKQKEHLRKGYCAFGSETDFPRYSSIEKSIGFLLAGGAEKLNPPMLGVAYHQLGSAYEDETHKIINLIFHADSQKRAEEQLQLAESFRHKSRGAYKKAVDFFSLIRKKDGRVGSNWDYYFESAQRELEALKAVGY